MMDYLALLPTILLGVFSAVALDWAAFEKLIPDLRLHSSAKRETGYWNGSKVRFLGVGFTGAYGALCVAHDLHGLFGASTFAFVAMVALRFYEIYPEQRAFWFGLLALGLIIVVATISGIISA